MQWFRVTVEVVNGEARRTSVELQAENAIEALQTACEPRVTGIGEDESIDVLCERLSEPVGVYPRGYLAEVCEDV